MGVAVSAEVLSLWPSNVKTPDAEYGDQETRVRAFLYTREDGTTRFCVISAEGMILAKTPVESYQFNSGGVEIVTPSGEWVVIPVVGCTTCGGGNSAGIAYQLLRGQGDE
jgi:hypothetical protein